MWGNIYLWEHRRNAGINQGLCTDLDPVVDEAAAVASRPQMGVFLCAGHLDAPHRLPGLIELAVNGVNPRVVWSHCIAHICWYAMLLERGERRGGGQGKQRRESYGQERKEERGMEADVSTSASNVYNKSINGCVNFNSKSKTD